MVVRPSPGATTPASNQPNIIKLLVTLLNFKLAAFG
jgi:hypothetical protein